jgi:two-component system, NtrC family, nitrogen regulation response regulator NtrX
MKPSSILVVDDEPEIRRLVQEILQDENYQVLTAENAGQARELYENRHPDLVLLDIWMPDIDGISLLKEWTEDDGLDTPVVIMSGHGTVETAVEATRLGAYDYIEKPVSMGKLLVTIERALESQKLRKENLRLRYTGEPDPLTVGKSTTMTKLREQLNRVGATDAWVFITGEPGSGKSVAARYLHHHSPRQREPYVEVNLAALTHEHLPLRLFGEQSGHNVTPGAFEAAQGGTLVFNQIGDLALADQSLILHALTEKNFRRIGGETDVPLDFRLISINTGDLETAVTQGRFIEDLYYHLTVVPLQLPPLRDHREDIPDLVNFYVDWFVDKEHLDYRRFSTSALNALRNHTWPGNFRELKNVIQRLLITHSGEEIDGEEVGRALGKQITGSLDTLPPALFLLPLREARDEFEKAYLTYLLEQTQGNVTEVARLSQMERTNLYRKLKSLGINIKEKK